MITYELDCSIYKVLGNMYGDILRPMFQISIIQWDFVSNTIYFSVHIHNLFVLQINSLWNLTNKNYLCINVEAFTCFNNSKRIRLYNIITNKK